MKKILVIGGSGFLGGNLCEYLATQNYEVYCFDLVERKFTSKVNFLKRDFFNDSDLEDAIEGMDCVIHAISSINPGNSNVKYMVGYEKDFLQTIKLCNMLIEREIKMVFISSGGTVYGNHVKQPIVEGELPIPINHYGNIKLSIENVLRTFNYQMGTEFIIARISNLYGRGQDYKKGVGFIDAVLKNTMNGLPIEIWGDGNNIRDYIYIDDVCKMIESLIEYSGKEDTFNISSKVGVSQNDIISIVKSMGLNPRVTYKDSRLVDVRCIILDNKKILGVWDGEITSIEKGIKEYFEYLNENA